MKQDNIDNNNVGIMLIEALLNEIVKLNKMMISKPGMADPHAQKGTFLYGVNPLTKVDSATYKRHVAFSNAMTRLLEEFDISKKINGYAYMRESVKMIIDQNRFDIRLCDDVYPYIKSKFNLHNTSVVEHNIRNAIKSSYKRWESGISNSRMKEFSYRPTNKEFLFMLAHEVNRYINNELSGSTS